MDIELLKTLPWVVAIGIFFMRVFDMTLDTIRVLFVVRGRKVQAWVLGFFQSIIYVVAISSVLANLDNPFNIIGYAAGFASGNVLGMVIEERMAIGHIQMTVISSRRGAVITDQLRKQGYAVTVIPARGKDGAVEMINCSVLRKDVDHVEAVVRENDPEAFITAEDIRPIRRGFWRA